MKNQSKQYTIRKFTSLFLIAAVISGCASPKQEIPVTPSVEAEPAKTIAYEVDPETFSLTIGGEDGRATASQPGEKRRVANYARNGTETKWQYPDDRISVSIKPQESYLYVTITSETEEDNDFKWPVISGETYYMPYGEGKRIPQNDETWNRYLSGNEFSVLEQLSMPFWATASGDLAVTYLMENPYRSDMVFSEDKATSFSLNHQYPAIDKEKDNSFRIYLTANDPVAVSKAYRNYVIEQGDFLTLEQKAEQNPNIRKLYGAPHIYLWGENLIAPENVNWPAFRTSMDGEVMKHILQLSSETGLQEEIGPVVEEIASQDYVSDYQKNIICRYLSKALQLTDFYDSGIFTRQNGQMEELSRKGMDTLNTAERVTWNKHALAENLPGVFRPADEWMDRDTVNLLDELKASGIGQAWIGLNSWEQAYAKPELAAYADSLGYLIGPYDSYHSIHEPGKEQWITAAFDDISLYETATVQDKNGEKLSGFQNVGRKLNPVLSMPSVEQRVGEIVSIEKSFQSWFIDCDATGEIYDDYSKEHVTTQQEDLKARLERMAYIRDNYHMVIGSEGGNDFAASTVAFAHGIELKTFSWMDEDMKVNKDSEYYIGKYYNPAGGVAEHFSKQIPVKEYYDTIFVDPSYDLPLYKLVYNDSVITGYHWDWSTFKIKGRVEDRMLREVLYNVPPLYHLDGEEWNKYKEDIKTHTNIWSEFSRQAITEEMTGFANLTEDGLVQRTQYGTGLSVTANFGDAPYSLDGKEIPAHGLLIDSNGETTFYVPTVSEGNR